MYIPFVDLKSQYQSIKNEIDRSIQSVIQECSFIGGETVKSFEKAFGELYDVKHVISCANGTDSLYIIMKMLGIGPGDEVVTVANSWISSSETITQCGANPVFVDCDPVYYSIDEHLLEEAINNRTKAVIVVHLHGQLSNLDAILSICQRHNILIIEDCAQSHFSEYKGRKAGTFGIAGSFSFYPGKNLGAYGDAGCIITNDDELAKKCRMYANHGSLKKHHHEIEGINSRMDGLQAAILSAKLPHILNWTDKRIENSVLYNEQLSNITQISLPAVRPQTKHTFHLYVIKVQERNELAAYLKTKNIETAIHYPLALPNLPAYHYLKRLNKSYPVATSLQSQILSLPIYPELDEAKIKFIKKSIEDFYKK